MNFNKSTSVQCFYNVNLNLGAPDGCSKFCWGFGRFYLHDSDKPLLDQIKERLNFGEHEVFNLNLIAFTPFPYSVFENAEEVDNDD